LYEIATGQIAAGMWKTVAGAVVLTESEYATSTVPALMLAIPVLEPAEPLYVNVSLVAPWYATLHFSMKLETDEAPLPVMLTAKAEGVIATTAATATTAAFENTFKRMVCLS
jgi:hypothetical protein